MPLHDVFQNCVGLIEATDQLSSLLSLTLIYVSIFHRPHTSSGTSVFLFCRLLASTIRQQQQQQPKQKVLVSVMESQGHNGATYAALQKERRRNQNTIAQRKYREFSYQFVTLCCL